MKWAANVDKFFSGTENLKPFCLGKYP